MLAREVSLIKYAFAAAVVLAATPAIAADFNGPRIEGRGSYDRVSLVVLEDGTTLRDDGLGYGIEAGYDAPISAELTLGAYAGIESATTKACVINSTERYCLGLGRNVTGGARIGFAVSPSMLVFAKGGYSNGRLKADYRNTAVPANNVSEGANRDGFHIGFGIEANVGNSAYVKAEYVRTNYKDVSSLEDEVILKAHRDQGVIGFGVRF